EDISGWLKHGWSFQLTTFYCRCTALRIGGFSRTALSHYTRFHRNRAVCSRLQSSDHRDDLVLIGLLRLRYANLLAAPEYADVIRKAEYLIETVTNNKDCQIARFP